jgi:hypothetical protein
MSYTLQPDLLRVQNPAVPPNCANDSVFVYPQPSSLNYANPSTMIYGTAPYMAGKGAPNELIMVDDELRPQSTTQFNRKYLNNTRGEYFPIQDMKCSVPLRTRHEDPMSSRAEVQNGLFTKRYCSK